MAHGKISGNMLDGAGQYSIQIETTSATTYPSFIDIFGNTGCDADACNIARRMQ